MSSLPPLPPMPPTLNYAQPLQPQIDLQKVAMRQRAIMFCILGEIALIVVLYGVPATMSPFVLLAILATSIIASVFVFMLALLVFNTTLGILLGILTLIPYLGIVPLLVVNRKATGILRQNNIRVGLLGANPNQFS
jgi:hypothetical protein